MACACAVINDRGCLPVAAGASRSVLGAAWSARKRAVLITLTKTDAHAHRLHTRGRTRETRTDFRGFDQLRKVGVRVVTHARQAPEKRGSRLGLLLLAPDPQKKKLKRETHYHKKSDCLFTHSREHTPLKYLFIRCSGTTFLGLLAALLFALLLFELLALLVAQAVLLGSRAARYS